MGVSTQTQQPTDHHHEVPGTRSHPPVRPRLPCRVHPGRRPLPAGPGPLAVGMYLNQVKDSTKKALDHLDDTEYKAYKLQLSTSLDNLATQLQTYQAAAAPYTDAVAAQVSEAIEPLRASISADIDQLRADLA